jgi:hypothetical protein
MDTDKEKQGCWGRLGHRSETRYLSVELTSQEEYETLYARSEPKPGGYRHVYLPQDRIPEYIKQWKENGFTIRKDRKIDGRRMERRMGV